MKNFLILFIVSMCVVTHSCNRKDNARAIAPAFTWSYDGNSYSATYIQIDYSAQFGGYYEPVVVFENAAEIHTLTIGLTNGQAVGSHTVTGYWVNYVMQEKGNPNLDNIVFQTYSIDVTNYNGNFVSGSFSANNASGPTLTGNFTDINSVP